MKNGTNNRRRLIGTGSDKLWKRNTRRVARYFPQLKNISERQRALKRIPCDYYIIVLKIRHCIASWKDKIAAFDSCHLDPDARVNGFLPSCCLVVKIVHRFEIRFDRSLRETNSCAVNFRCPSPNSTCHYIIYIM